MGEFCFGPNVNTPVATMIIAVRLCSSSDGSSSWEGSRSAIVLSRLMRVTCLSMTFKHLDVFDGGHR